MALSAASSEELASTSEEVSAHAMELNAIMDFFQLAGDGRAASQWPQVERARAAKPAKGLKLAADAGFTRF